MATWNMQRSPGRWSYALELSDRASVVALQEASVTPPAGAVPLRRIGRNIRAYRIPATRVLQLPQHMPPSRAELSPSRPASAFTT